MRSKSNRKKKKWRFQWPIFEFIKKKKNSIFVFDSVAGQDNNIMLDIYRCALWL